MARDTCPAMLIITSSPAPDSDSSVTSVWRLSCHRPTTFALSRTFVHAVFNEVTGRVGSFGCPLPAGNTYHSGLHSPNRGFSDASSAGGTHTKDAYRFRRPCGRQPPRWLGSTGFSVRPRFLERCCRDAQDRHRGTRSQRGEGGT